VALEPTSTGVATSEVATYERVQCRARRHERAVRDYAEGYRASEIVAPLWVARLPDGTRLLIDGNHRLDGALEAKQPQLNVQVFDVKTRLEALRLAIKRAREAMGLRFSLEDRQSSAEQELILDPSQSNRSIGNDCGLSHPTVQKIRERLEADGKIFQQPTRQTSDGKTRPAKNKPSARSATPAPTAPAAPAAPAAPTLQTGESSDHRHEDLPRAAAPAPERPAAPPEAGAAKPQLALVAPARAMAAEPVALDADACEASEGPWDLQAELMDLHTELDRVRRLCPARDVLRVARFVESWLVKFKESAHGVPVAK